MSAYTQGTAIDASFANENGQMGYDITTVASDGSRKDVFVDATSGNIRAQTPDSEKEHDGPDGGEQESHE